MNSHSHHRWEQKGFSSKSANTSGHSHPSATDADLASYSSKASPVHSRGLAVSDQPLRLAECDRWSVDSPRESGYHSEESSVGHGGELNSTSRFHASES